MNLIQYRSSNVKFFTSMLDVENWMEISLDDFDWHMSPTEGGWKNLNNSIWITGLELKNKLEKYDHQFIWSVFSAYPKGTKPFTSDIPYADDNPDFWKGSPSKQLSDSLFEIVCWDSSATLFIGLSEEQAKCVIKNAPGIQDLDRFNI